MPDFSTYAWNELAPATSPSARFGHAMVWDGARIILFGGANDNAFGLGNNDETWEFDGTTWTDLAPASAPSARKFHSMVWDGTQAILHGGASATSGATGLQDTWVFDGSDWTDVTPGGTKPPVRSRHLAAWDGTRMIIYGGQTTGGVILKDTWKFEAGAWTQLTPTNHIANILHNGLPPDGRAGMPAVWDGAQVIVFSGYSDSGGGGEFQTSSYQESGGGTWVYASADWTQPGPGTNPNARWGQAFCITDDDQKLLMFGGNVSYVGGAGLSFNDETWQYDGTDWDLLSRVTHPSARNTTMVWDDDNARGLLFGGNQGTSGSVFFDDTWEFATSVVPEPAVYTIRHTFGLGD